MLDQLAIERPATIEQRLDAAAGLDHVALVATRGEVEEPGPEGRVEPRLDRERRVVLEQALEPFTDHARLGQRQDVARADEAAIAVRAAAADGPPSRRS